MYIHDRIELAASKVISSSLAQNGIANWSINTAVTEGSSTEYIQYPCVQIVCNKSEPLIKNVPALASEQKALLTISTAGIKTEISASTFNQISDEVIMQPFFMDNICGQLNSYLTDIFVKGVFDMGMDLTTIDDGWFASKTFEVIAARTS